MSQTISSSLDVGLVQIALCCVTTTTPFNSLAGHGESKTGKLTKHEICTQVRKPVVLLLDEATSALDSESEVSPD